MFKLIKNFLKNKEQESDDEQQAALLIHINSSGEIVVDVRINDESQESLQYLATILACLTGSAFQIQVLHIIRDQFFSSNKHELYSDLIIKIVELVGLEEFMESTEENSEGPCINPSDTL